MVGVVVSPARLAVAYERAAASCRVASQLCERAASLLIATEALREVVQQRRWRRMETFPTGFLLDAMIDGEPVYARCQGSEFEASVPLRQRAEAVVGLRDAFELGDPPVPVVASLEGPAALTLATLMRAADDIVRIELHG
jgi:hypothetical protein